MISIKKSGMVYNFHRKLMKITDDVRKADRLGLVDARPVIGRVAAEGHVQVLEERVEALGDGHRRGRVRLQRKAPLMHMI